MLSTPQLRGIADELARELAEQRNQYEAHIALLDARIVTLERILGLRPEPNASAPGDGASARH